MSISVKMEIIPSQKAGQHNIQDNPVPENIEECSPRQGNFLMNSPCTSTDEYSSLVSQSRNASVSFSEITMEDDNGSIENSVLADNRHIVSVCYSADICTTFDDSTLQNNSDKLVRPSTSTKTEFMNNALTATESDKQNVSNSKEPDESSPSTKRFKRSSSTLQNKACGSRFRQSSLGFVMRCNPKKIVFGNMADETSTVEENCSENNSDVESEENAEEEFAEESSNQPRTESIDSEKEISFVGNQQSECDRSSQYFSSFHFPSEVKNLFEKIFKGIDLFNKRRPQLSTQMIQQFLSHRRQFVTLQNSQHHGRLEAMHRLAECLKSRVVHQLNALKHTDTQSISTSQEHAQEPKEIAPRSVAESSLRKPPINSNLRNRLFCLHNDLVDDLKMLMQLSKLILEEYANDRRIDFEKIFDYVLCFEIMKEDYSEKLKRFKNMGKDAKSDSGRCSYGILLLHVQCLIKVFNKYIAKVEYGIFLLKLHENLNNEVRNTSTRIKQMVRMIKVSEFRTKTK